MNKCVKTIYDTRYLRQIEGEMRMRPKPGVISGINKIHINTGYVIVCKIDTKRDGPRLAHEGGEVGGRPGKKLTPGGCNGRYL